MTIAKIEKMNLDVEITFRNFEKKENYSTVTEKTVDGHQAAYAAKLTPATISILTEDMGDGDSAAQADEHSGIRVCEKARNLQAKLVPLKRAVKCVHAKRTESGYRGRTLWEVLVECEAKKVTVFPGKMALCLARELNYMVDEQEWDECVSLLCPTAEAACAWHCLISCSILVLI